MSADNYVGVLPLKDGRWGLISDGNMSRYCEDCMYRGEVTKTFGSRADALVAAHDEVKECGIVEYGVIELDPVPDTPCGRCIECVHERKVVDADIPRCDACNMPIVNSDWMVMTQSGQYHSRCEPRLKAVE